MAVVAEVDWAAFPHQEWFLYDFAQGMLVLRPGRGTATDQKASEVLIQLKSK